MLHSNYVFCVLISLISLQSCEDEEGGLCEVVDCCLFCFHGRGSFGEHLMSHAHWPNEVVVAPLLGTDQTNDTPGKAKLCIVPPPPTVLVGNLPMMSLWFPHRGVSDSLKLYLLC